MFERMPAPVVMGKILVINFPFFDFIISSFSVIFVYFDEKNLTNNFSFDEFAILH